VQPTFGLAIWWLDVVSFIILSLSAAVSADVILLGFCLLASSFVFLLCISSGLDVFQIPPHRQAVSVVGNPLVKHLNKI
jgi:hypothetical protein